MAAADWLTLASCVALLGFAALVVLARRQGGKLAVLLALIAVALFVFEFGMLAYTQSGDRAWHLLDVTASPLVVPLALHLIVVFVGRSYALRWITRGAYVFFGSLSLCSALAFSVPAARAIERSPIWAALFLSGLAASIALGVVLLVLHARRVEEREERSRTWLVLLAWVLGALLGSTELIAGLGAPVPRLGAVAAVVSVALLTASVLRFRLVPTEPSARGAVLAALAGAIGVAAYIAIFALLATRTAVAVAATIAVTIALVAVTRWIAATFARTRERREQLLHLGRASAQMAHDLKNPVAAMRGAAEFLKEEIAQGRSIDTQAEMIDVILDETRRMRRIIDAYRRLATLQPEAVPAALDAILRASAPARARASGGAAIDVALEIDDALPPCQVDPDLVAQALENVVSNAIDAMHDGGTLTLGARREPRGARDGVALFVKDTGVGMDARTREQALEEFFSTKGSSGLGLAFVRRAIEAHGGAVALQSEVGRGTVVRLWLPAS